MSDRAGSPDASLPAISLVQADAVVTGAPVGTATLDQPPTPGDLIVIYAWDYSTTSNAAFGSNDVMSSDGFPQLAV